MSTTTYKGSIIQVTSPNLTADWSLSNASLNDLDALEPGIPVSYIQYTPGASADVCVVKDRNDAGPIIAKFECADAYSQKIVYFSGMRCKPYVDISAGTYGKTVNSILTIGVE